MQGRAPLFNGLELVAQPHLFYLSIDTPDWLKHLIELQQARHYVGPQQADLHAVAQQGQAARL